jgi:hypothetical protein
VTQDDAERLIAFLNKAVEQRLQDDPNLLRRAPGYADFMVKAVSNAVEQTEQQSDTE